MAFERMTEYESVAGHAHAVPVADPDVAMMRLAAYEDTELSPEQIQEAVDILKRKCLQCVKTQVQMIASKKQVTVK